MSLISRNPTIYLISGKARHGKSTFGKFLKQELEESGKKVAYTQYAKYLKMYAKDFFGWDGKEESKPRELLDRLGTEIIRVGLNKPMFFVNRFCEDVEILSYFFDAIIVDDIRIPIEIEIPKEKFKNVVSIKIVRKNADDDLTSEQKSHYTEIALDSYDKYDIIIENNGMLDDLLEKAKEISNKVIY